MTRIKKTVFAFLLLLVIVAIAIGFMAYRMIYAPNAEVKNVAGFSLKIKDNANFNDVKEILYKNNVIKNKTSFEFLAKLMKYTGNVKPGHYIIKNGMSNKKLINKLRAGRQDAVKLIFNNIRTKQELAGRLAQQLKIDSVSFMDYMTNDEFLKKYSFSSETVIAMFIPNTYEMYWDTKPEKFFDKMYSEYQKFWNAERESKLGDINLDKLQVMTLASIVEKESNKSDERPVIAGVYMNRLHQNWPLQADPTIVFAVGDFSIKRVLNEHKAIESPYNTYKHAGLPPAPICIPSISSIDAVLNYQRHDYMFFCAREDFSGYHNFASSLQEHDANAKRYQSALDRQGIK